MAKLDARNWMEFRIGDIFRMNNTKSIVQKDVVPDSGTVPYVTAQAGNNGVMTFIDCPPEWMDEGDCIMIGGKTLTFSYQEKAFCSNDSHNIALHLKETDKASEARYLFLITALGSVRISVSGEVIPGAAQRGCPLYLRCSMPDLMR